MREIILAKRRETRRRFDRSSRLAAGALASLILAGCAGNSTTRIVGENTSVFQPAVRASFNVNGGGRPASETRSGHAIEIGYQGTRITSDQSLQSGQPPVIHNGTTFLSPDRLKNDFDFSYSDISWRMREFAGSKFGIEVLAGLGFSSLGLTVSSSTQRASQNFSNTGLQFGFGLIWRSSSESSIHARGSYFIALDNGVSDITKYDIYYAYAIHKNLSLRLGYSDWKVNGFGESGMSNFQMHLAGPALVLDWNFNLGN